MGCLTTYLTTDTLVMDENYVVKHRHKALEIK